MPVQEEGLEGAERLQVGSSGRRRVSQDQMQEDVTVCRR